MQLHSIGNLIYSQQIKKDRPIHPVLKECAFYKTPSVFMDAKELNNMIAQYMNPRYEIDEAVFEEVNPYQVQFPLPLIKMHSYRTVVPSSQVQQNLALQQLIRSIRRTLRIKTHTAPIQTQIKEKSLTPPIILTQPPSIQPQITEEPKPLQNPETPSQTMAPKPSITKEKVGASIAFCLALMKAVQYKFSSSAEQDPASYAESIQPILLTPNIIPLQAPKQPKTSFEIDREIQMGLNALAEQVQSGITKKAAKRWIAELKPYRSNPGLSPNTHLALNSAIKIMGRVKRGNYYSSVQRMRCTFNQCVVNVLRK